MPTLTREERKIEINGAPLTYILQRSVRRRRTIQLQLDTEYPFKVLVPHTLAIAEVERFIHSREDWIIRHRLHEMKPVPKRDWGAGGKIMYRGRDIELVIRERDADDPGLNLPPAVTKSLTGDIVEVSIPPGWAPERRSEEVESCLIGWYRQEAMDHLKLRVSEFGNVMGVSPRRLKLSNAMKRWGSCSERGNVNLNWRLIMLNDRLIDYVVVHELSHLIELNHSRRFWNVLAGVLPDCQELRRNLKAYSPSELP